MSASGATSGFACPACGGVAAIPFYTVAEVPAVSTPLLPDREGALAVPKAEIALCRCARCGLIFNGAFDSSLVVYDGRYQDSQGGSETFGRFATALADEWIDRYDLRGKRVLEVGCGQGEFLRLICANGGCEGVGYDPAYVAPGGGEPRGVTIHAEKFTLAQTPADADFVVCRHTLEHVGDVAGFLCLLRAVAGDRPDVRYGIEVPDVLRILEEGAFWDVYHEHANYFGTVSLAHAARIAGFDILDLRRVYGGQYLVLEAGPAAPGEGPVAVTADDPLAGGFGRKAARRIDWWRQAFTRWSGEGRGGALWGSGSKAVGFLTAVNDPTGFVRQVVDINPRRQGFFMPGCAAPIVTPDALIADPPDVVIVMNAMYREEIDAALIRMGLKPRILAVDDPSPEMAA